VPHSCNFGGNGHVTARQWLVGRLAFNGTFSTNRLYHAMVILNMSFRGGAAWQCSGHE